MTAHVASVITGLPASDTRLKRIIEAQDEDQVCRQIKKYCSECWPDKHSVKDAMKTYWSTRGELTVVQNILLRGTRIVIPSSMRLEILDKIDEGHQGTAKCRERAKGSVWWPGLSREIQDLVQQCRTCALHRDNKPEPLIATPLPDRPWQIVATDLFQMRGMDYLIVIDYYSRYVEVAAMTKTTKSSEVIRALMSIFARHGIPEQVKLKQQSNFNLRHKATPLTPLEPGTEVHVKDLNRPGVVVKAAETPRSYEVKDTHQHREKELREPRTDATTERKPTGTS
ncbi:uncharacterized protein K02A2.6-like [Acropora millepora]|uniref:uncharacterized protein K02A2.6-like n=1 Tax=Acropora millepora TaxID=45264 RepID=UPI001CF2260A|nr:uncharacterized protein K02A2.6-like [Acropora millepora]